ncbi:replication restart helicase PriA, partial [Atopobiaceae bacterium HCP3S3_F7]
MRYASVVVDIATRALDEPFDYVVPEGLAGACAVGATVLVTFSHRHAVGYVVALADEAPAGVGAGRLLPVEAVLAPPAFDEAAARVALWLAREYACPPADAVRPFLAPGQTVKVTRAGEGAPWELVCESSGPVDERWVALGEAAEGFRPRANASRQRQVIEALEAGPMHLAELAATAGAVSQT